MNWTIVILLVAAVVVFVMLQRAGPISSEEARKRLKEGALLIDVRSAGEFNSGHLPSAINMPVEEIETVLPRRVKDRDQVVLLHCQSGSRSGMAKEKLKGLGYANTFNLGSNARAANIVSDRKTDFGSLC